MRRLIARIADVCTAATRPFRRASRFASRYRKYRRLGNIHIVAWRLARDQQ